MTGNAKDGRQGLKPPCLEALAARTAWLKPCPDEPCPDELRQQFAFYEIPMGSSK